MYIMSQSLLSYLRIDTLSPSAPTLTSTRHLDGYFLRIKGDYNFFRFLFPRSTLLVDNRTASTVIFFVILIATAVPSFPEIFQRNFLAEMA